MKWIFSLAFLLFFSRGFAQDTPENVRCNPYMESEVKAGTGNTYSARHPVVLNGVKFNAQLMNQDLVFRISFISTQTKNCIEQGASFKFTFADSTVLELPTESKANCKGNAYFYLSNRTAKATFCISWLPFRCAKWIFR